MKGTETWDKDEYNHYLATGHKPRRDHTQPPVEPKCECASHQCDEECDERHAFRGPTCPECAPPEREVVEVKTGRHHRKLVKDANVGVTFDSLTEARRYDWLVALPHVIHVDVHPVLTLPHGIRYFADFLVHMKYEGGGRWPLRIEDVKSKKGLTTDFKRLKKIVDDVHPFGPLVVVQWLNGAWKETR